MKKRLEVVAGTVMLFGCAVFGGGHFPLQAVAAPFIRGADAQTEQPPAPHASSPAGEGAAVYAEHCAICHGDHREGILPAFPPLAGITRQKNNEQIAAIIRTGKGRMPGFPKLANPEVASLLRYLGTSATPETAASSSGEAGAAHSSPLSEAGGVLFGQNCAFCHGRDAMGGETGPDLTRSKLVRTDMGGDKISEVVRNGRPEKKMPAFNFSNAELSSLAAFIHTQEAKAVSQKGARRGVEVADLQTGNVQAGKTYFQGAGTCATCHSPTGDLAGIASRYEGLQLEERMLYPKDAKSTLSVTLPSGRTMTGTLAYRDEFTLALRDSEGSYHSWPVAAVKYTVSSPVDAHVELFSRYTDADIHNLMAYLQTLR